MSKLQFLGKRDQNGLLLGYSINAFATDSAGNALTDSATTFTVA